MDTINPSFAEFSKLIRKGNLVPLSCEILADMDTPVSAYARLRKGAHGFLLESVEGGERWARYSFLGLGAAAVFRAKGNTVEVIEKGRGRRRKQVDDPFLAFRDLMKRYRPVAPPGMPRFYGGAVGYLSYDTVRHFERLPVRCEDVLNVWDIYLVFPESLLIFDNVRHTIRVVSCCELGRYDTARGAYDATVREIRRTIERLRTPLRRRLPPAREGRLRVTGNMGRRTYMGAVRKAKDYVRSGDIIQVVLSQRLEVEENIDPVALYRALRLVNPSPYMFLLDVGDYALVGSSPEVLVRVEGSSVEVRPIAGTRPRGRNATADAKLAEDLRRDEKEIAEHVMLVDLGRNDVGRVSAPGSVVVEELMTLENYSHVMHLVSHVRGNLARGKDCFDAFRSCFPAGTLTGAPKIRAMEIIEELEPHRRGPYGGAVGYFGFSGAMDMAIAIRTVLAKRDRLYVQAGAGIVADSRPAREYEECRNKARAMIKAIQMARQGLSFRADWESGVDYDLHD